MSIDIPYLFSNKNDRRFKRGLLDLISLIVIVLFKSRIIYYLFLLANETKRNETRFFLLYFN
jgi:hypothetical protein